MVRRGAARRVDLIDSTEKSMKFRLQPSRCLYNPGVHVMQTPYVMAMHRSSASAASRISPLCYIYLSYAAGIDALVRSEFSIVSIQGEIHFYPNTMYIISFLQVSVRVPGCAYTLLL